MSYENYPRFTELQGQNLLCIDYGRKVTGFAYFSPGKEPYPIPHDKVIYKDDDSLIDAIGNIIEDDFIDILILGIPYLLDGTVTQMTLDIKDFGNKLQKRNPKQRLYFQDETLSTQTAKDRMRNSPEYNFKIDLKKIDQLAAVIILEDFIKS